MDLIGFQHDHVFHQGQLTLDCNSTHWDMKGGLHCFRLWLATGSHKLHRTTPGFCGSHWRFIVWKCHLPIGRHFVQDSNMLNQIRKYILAAWHGNTLSITGPFVMALQWRHNGPDSASYHQPHDCFLHRLFRRWSKETSKLCVTGLCVGNSPGTSEFPAQMASYAENVSIWWRHRGNPPVAGGFPSQTTGN